MQLLCLELFGFGRFATVQKFFGAHILAIAGAAFAAFEQATGAEQEGEEGHGKNGTYELHSMI